MRVVDAHFHLWDTVANPYPWLTGSRPGSPEAELARRFPRYLGDEYRCDCRERFITAGVHVQADWEGFDPVGETRWLQALSDVSGLPAAIVAAADLESPTVRATLEAHLLHPAVRGIRQPLAWDTDPAMRAAERPDLIGDRAWRRGFALLAPLGLSFDVTAYPAQLADVATLAAAHPGASIVIDHAGLPDVAARDRALWSDALRRLADCENVTIKLSGLAQPGRTVEQMHEYADEVVAAFGCERAMFGSNLPVEHLGGSPDGVVEAIARALSRRATTERDAVWRGTATRVYRLSDVHERSLH